MNSDVRTRGTLIAIGCLALAAAVSSVALHSVRRPRAVPRAVEEGARHSIHLLGAEESGAERGNAARRLPGVRRRPPRSSVDERPAFEFGHGEESRGTTFDAAKAGEESCAAALSDVVSAATADFGTSLLSAALDAAGSDAAPHALVISPVSVFLAVSLAMQGATEEASAGIGRAMGLCGGVHPRSEGFGKVVKDLSSYLTATPSSSSSSSSSPSSSSSSSSSSSADAAPTGKVTIANAAFVADGLELTEGFEERARRYFSGEVHSARFGTAEGRREVDAWVSARTGGMIRELGAPLPARSPAVLLNAVYFDLAWERAFDRRRTRHGRFARSVSVDGTPSLVDAAFLCADGRFAHAEDRAAGFEAVAIDYAHPHGSGRGGAAAAGPEYEALFVLPNAIGAERDLARRLARRGALDALRASMSLRKGHVEVPRVSGMETTVDMGATLARVGVDLSRVALSEMVRGTAAHVGEVLHKTVVSVSEEGTRAAAVTAIVMRALVRPAIPEAEPFRFVADRPVFLFIRDKLSGATLFGGIVNK